MLAAFHPLLTDGAARVGREKLKGRGVPGAGDDHDGVLKGAVVFEGLHGLGDRGVLLTYGHVDALHPLTLLVQDGVNHDRRLAGLAVADDQLALTAAAPMLGIDEWSLAVDRLAERVDHPTQQGVTHGHRKDAARRSHDLLFFDGIDRTEDHRTNGLLVEVHRQTHGAVFKLEQFVHSRRGQSRHARDAVTDLHDASHLLGLDGRIEVGHILAQRFGNLGSANGELSHHSFPFLVISI